MKENELMKFDWVMFDEENYEPYEIKRVYMQVDHFNCGTVYGKTNRQSAGTRTAFCEEDGLYSSREYRKVMPVPLTPEILENNGFKYEESYNEWWHYDPFPFSDFQIGYEDEDDMRLAINGDTTNIKLKYVHQLQHALRLYGLNELSETALKI